MFNLVHFVLTIIIITCLLVCLLFSFQGSVIALLLLSDRVAFWPEG